MEDRPFSRRGQVVLTLGVTIMLIASVRPALYDRTEDSMTRLTLATAVLLFAGLSGLGQTAAGQEKSQPELRRPFIGSWRLVSIEGGNDPVTRGPKPTGIIMYDERGNMAVQIQPDRQRPTYTGTPSVDQMAERMRGYVAYFGTYAVDVNAGIVTHHRQGMLDSGAVDFVRKFEFSQDGNRITLTPVGGSGPPTRLTWERVR